MKEVLTIAGPTPDPEFIAQYPDAVREWCINTAAVDAGTMSVMVNSEDGKLYRWNLSTNTLSETVTLTSGIGEAYTPTIIGTDGTVYAINGAILNAVGRRTAGTVSISIGNASVTEGNTGTANTLFTVSLSAASANTVSVHYASADGTAMAGSDYTAVSGTLTFAPGETSKTISVAVAGDTINEPDETFVVNLSNPSNATIADGQGQATILNDDPPPPSLSIGDVTVNEGNSGVTSAVFSVTLSSASSQTVTVNYASADGSAKVATKDYVAVSGTLTFAPGQTTGTIVVSITGDRKREKDETFFVNLSSPSNATIARGQGRGTIRNDD